MNPAICVKIIERAFTAKIQAVQIFPKFVSALKNNVYINSSTLLMSNPVLPVDASEFPSFPTINITIYLSFSNLNFANMLVVDGVFT